MDNCLDVIRLFAALQVAITHYLNLTIVEYGITDGTDTCLLWFKRALSLYPGVVILFTVSGFLMGASLEKQDSRSAFLKKRFLRIYPGLWANMAFMVLVVLLTAENVLANSRAFLIWGAVQGMGLAFTPGFLKSFGTGSINGALWTIMVEVQFYLLIWLFWHFLRKQSNRFWMGMTLLAAAANLGSWFVKDKGMLPESILSLLDRTFLPYLLWFCLGFLIYRYKEKVLPALVSVFPALFAAFSVYKACWLLLGWQVPGYYTDLVTSVVLPCVVLGGAYCFGKHRIRREISYGIFLYHWPLINLVFTYDLPLRRNRLLLFAGYLVLSVLLACLSSRLVEQPCTKYFFAKKNQRRQLQEGKSSEK